MTVSAHHTRIAYTPERSVAIWGGIAVAIGVAVSVFPPPVVLILGLVIAFCLVTLISPASALIGLMILSPLRTLIATEAAFQLPIDIGQISFAATLLTWGIHRVARGLPILPIRWTALSSSLVLFLLVSGLSAWEAVSISAWLNEWLKWIQIFILVLLVVNQSAEISWEWLLFGLVLAGIANAFIGIYEFFGGSGALHLLINDRFFRAFGTFGQPNPFAGFMGLLMPLSLMATIGYASRVVFHRSSGQKREIPILLAAYYAFSSMVLAAGMLMSWSRGGWLGLVSSVAVIAIALPKQTRRGLLLLVTIGGLIAALWFAGLIPASVVERLATSTQEFFAFEDVRGVDIDPANYAVVERLAHWQAGLNMATAHPWVGVGFGNYEIVYPDYRLMNWSEPLGHAHNYYLNILAELGIIGLLGYGKVWFTTIRLSWKGRRHPDRLSRFICIGLLGSWAYLAIHSLFDNLYVNNLFLHIGLMLGLLIVLYNQSNIYLRLDRS